MDTYKKEFLVEEFSVYKKSALLLHSLHPSDCEWILNNLSITQSEKMRGLLREIIEIGLEPLDSDIKELTNNFISERNESEKNTDYRIQHIDAVTTNQIAIILNGEPENAIALLLAIHNWSWATAYLSEITVDSREKIKNKMADFFGNISDGIKDATLQHIIDELSIAKSSTV